MPTWSQIRNKVQNEGSTIDITRKGYINKLSEKTGRNTIVYYSGWLQRPELDGRLFSINDSDKNGFMNCIHKLDKEKGLDLILHTPGGDIAATESLVDYLNQVFNSNIRAIIPQLAMSAGTMIACSCYEIIMGIHSSLGPVDPQINNIPAHGVVEEFKKAIADVEKNPSLAIIWQPILSKYGPSFIGDCTKALDWSNSMVSKWLSRNMFKELTQSSQKKSKIDKILIELGDHSYSKSHSRHLSNEKCKSIGLKILDLEKDKEMQDIILSIHHSCCLTFESSNAIKIIQNDKGVAYIQQMVGSPQSIR